MAQCKYEKDDGTFCEEQALPESKKEYCIFHEVLINKEESKCMELFYNKIRNGETDFEGYILQDIDMKKNDIKKIKQKISFRDAKFYGKNHFHAVEFSQAVDFSGTTFTEDANFSGTTFTETVDFSSATFAKNASFRTATFAKNADFSCTTFAKNAYFSYATFAEFAYFSYATFTIFAYFSYATFAKNADFSDATFTEFVTFRGASFTKDASFRTASFTKDADFGDVTFAKNASFGDVTFAKNASFRAAAFTEIADFSNAVFERKGNFEEAKINHARFKNAELRHVSFKGVKLANSTFHGALIENAYLSDAIWESDWESYWRKNILREEREAVYGNKICKNCNTVIIEESQICKTCKTALNSETVEENEEYNTKRLDLFSKAEDVYRNIKLSISNSGNYDKSGEFYYNEMRIKRMRARYEKKYVYWFLNTMYSKLCGYGEKPGRVLLSWFAIILFFGTFYWLTNSLSGEGMNSIFDNYYFSVVNFTTLGFGDIHPIPDLLLGKVASMAEALIGAFMMALFVLVFGRKMLR